MYTQLTNESLAPRHHPMATVIPSPSSHVCLFCKPSLLHSIVCVELAAVAVTDRSLDLRRRLLLLLPRGHICQPHLIYDNASSGRRRFFHLGIRQKSIRVQFTATGSGHAFADPDEDKSSRTMNVNVLFVKQGTNWCRSRSSSGRIDGVQLGDFCLSRPSQAMKCFQIGGANKLMNATSSQTIKPTTRSPA